MYLAAAKNAAYAREGRASANDMAAETRNLFQAQTNLMNYFNKTFAGGKWDNFIDQTYIGYNSWRDPAQNNLRAVKLTEITVPDAAAMGVALDGGDMGALPQFDSFNRQRHYIDVFNKGKTPFNFAAASAPWILLDVTNGPVEKDNRLWVSVDWSIAPHGKSAAAVQIAGANTNFTINVSTLTQRIFRGIPFKASLKAKESSPSSRSISPKIPMRERITGLKSKTTDELCPE